MEKKLVYSFKLADSTQTNQQSSAGSVKIHSSSNMKTESLWLHYVFNTSFFYHSRFVCVNTDFQPGTAHVFSYKGNCPYILLWISIFFSEWKHQQAGGIWLSLIKMNTLYKDFQIWYIAVFS